MQIEGDGIRGSEVGVWNEGCDVSCGQEVGRGDYGGSRGVGEV